jgi:hypothetical protein
MLTRLLSRIAGLTSRGRSLRLVTDYSDRAESFRRGGRLQEALAAGREGLAIFRGREMMRHRVPERLLFLSLTVFVEEVAAELGCSGTDECDLVESVESLKRWREALERFPDLVSREPASSREMRSRWSQYLEMRLEARRRTTRCS